MCQYGLIVLMNVDDRDLPDKTADHLKAYVEEYGRSVLTTGGINTYVYGHMMDTAFDDFLPVRMEVQEEQSAQPVALMLVVDNSASMSKVQTAMASDTISPLEMAKRGAIRCISVLHDNDLIGVIGFSDSYYPLVDLTSAENRDYAVSRIARMNTVGGTMYVEALQEAYRQLKELDEAVKKHVIFISDGNPSDEGYREIIRAMHAEGMTLSTIAVGLGINKELMNELAALGGGEYNQVLNIDELPAIMLSDTVMQQAEYVIDTPLTPSLRISFGEMNAQETLPLIGGYIRTELRPEANLILQSPEGRPLYAQWRYGEGQAGALMSDLGSCWGKTWMDSSSGKAFVLQMIKNLIPVANNRMPVSVSLVQQGKTGLVLAQCIEAGNEPQRLEMDVRTPSGLEHTVNLVCTGAGNYEGHVPMDGEGRYDFVLRRYGMDGSLGETSETAAAVSWAKEYEMFWSQEERSMLEQACVTAGGAVFREAKEAAKVRMDEVYVDYSPAYLLSVLLMLTLMVDLIGRQIAERGRLLSKRTKSQ